MGIAVNIKRTERPFFVRKNARPELAGLADRVTFAVNSAGGITHVAKVLGRPKSSVDRWMNGISEAGVSEMARLAKETGVALEWLVNGEGSPRNETDAPNYSPDLVMIPRLSVTASAGQGSIPVDFQEIDAIPFSREALRRMRINPEHAHVLQAKGDSMVPTIADGALVIVDTSVQMFTGSGIYVFSLGDQVRLKRLAIPSDGGLLIISDNEKVYPREDMGPAQLAELEFRIHARVGWTDKVL